VNSLTVVFADPKDTRTIPRVDPTQGGGSILSLGIDTYRTCTGTRNTWSCFALTEHTRESGAGTSPNDSIGIANSKYARLASSYVRTLDGGDVWIARIKSFWI
jgi:hypothetical protein